METVAIYWEARIKTYGFQVVKDLVLCRYAIPADLSAPWDRAVERIEAGQGRFRLLSAQLGETGDLDALMLCDPDQGDQLASHIVAEMPGAAGRRRQDIVPAELLFFQGPHFGDRFGVADFTYRALADQADSLLAAVFSCASIYLIFPDGGADEAKARLADAFRVPG